jgi:hypothetical protein
MSAEPRPTEGTPTSRPRRASAPLRVRAVLAAHTDLVNNREQFPVAEADQGDIATLLLVLIDIQHAALELVRVEGAVVRKQLAAVKGEVVTLSRRAARAEDLMKELVKQAKAANVTASDQADLLDELVESITREGGERGEGEGEGEREGPEGDDPEEGHPEDGLGEAMREGEEAEEEEEEEEEFEDDDEPEDEGDEPTADVVVPDAILPAPAEEAGPRARFDHPEVK